MELYFVLFLEFLIQKYKDKAPIIELLELILKM